MPKRIYTQMSQLIGNTPLFELVCTPQKSRVLLKLEQFNPTGSAKIRMAQSMIKAAEQDNRLQEHGTIVESTSGNTGQGLALLALERGYDFVAVVDNHSCKDKLNSMRAMNAQMCFVSNQDDASLATSARENHAEELGKQHGWVFMKQHDNVANSMGYYPAADEILNDLGESPTHIISAVGTGGSLFGVTERLHQLGHRPTIIGVEPEGSIAFGAPGHDYWQSGTGTPEGAVIGTSVRYDLLDYGAKVSDKAAFAACRTIGKHMGLLLGGSAGGAVIAALELLPGFPAGSTSLTMVCDGGEKYLDTVFNDEWMSERGLLDVALEDKIWAQITSLRAGKSSIPLGSTRISWSKEK
ncbi:PLP-dependent cysteine synthase family protein [Corynebacterium amycolatum]|uniref:PLP-dependent cysteine synthase family protein n=1 Tax=Corynebacterium amycolatum TaxID=43765 RepID=UPI003AF6B7FD